MELPLYYVRWLVLAVVLYTAIVDAAHAAAERAAAMVKTPEMASA